MSLLYHWERESIRNELISRMGDSVKITRRSLDGVQFDPDDGPVGSHTPNETVVYQGAANTVSSEREPRRTESATEAYYIGRFIVSLPYDADVATGDIVYYEDSPSQILKGEFLVVLSVRPSTFDGQRRVYAEYPQDVGENY